MLLFAPSRVPPPVRRRWGYLWMVGHPPPGFFISCFVRVPPSRLRYSQRPFRCKTSSSLDSLFQAPPASVPWDRSVHTTLYSTCFWSWLFAPARAGLAPHFWPANLLRHPFLTPVTSKTFESLALAPPPHPIVESAPKNCLVGPFSDYPSFGYGRFLGTPLP